MKKKAKDFINNFWKVLNRPEMLVLPGQLAFFFIMSIVPILTIISYAASTFNLSIDFVSVFISKIFSNDIANLIVPAGSNPSLSFSFIFTIVIGLIMASNGAASMIVTSNTIYGIPDKGFLRRRLKSIIMTFFIIILFVFILVVPLFGNRIIDALNYLNIPKLNINNISFVITLLNGPISWLIIFVFIKILYTMAPDTKIYSKQTNYGALFTTFGWIIITMVYSVYINNYVDYSIFYGGLANIIILMLWLYLLSYIFTIGLALNCNNLEEKTNNKKVEITNNKNRSDK